MRSLTPRPCDGHRPALRTATWIYEQRWRRKHASPAAMIEILQTHLVRDRVPFTVVAVDEGVPASSCSVIENDCEHRPQYTPWVAAVLVQPALRKQGVASKVLEAAAVIAARAGCRPHRSTSAMAGRSSSAKSATRTRS